MKTIIKTYKKSINGFAERKLDEKMLGLRGYSIVEEEEIKQYNGAKGCLLFLLFPPLALLGRSKFIKITYEKNI
ncbi:MAG TPA: hypothetical protein DDY21_00130 [Candidatus Moranbacteria bacterium]|nr:hypothetical protein [Candidatus Moranbacteria bacterium]